MNRRVQHSLCIDYVFITIISLAYYSTDVYLFDALCPLENIKLRMFLCLAWSIFCPFELLWTDCFEVADSCGSSLCLAMSHKDFCVSSVKTKRQVVPSCLRTACLLCFSLSQPWTVCMSLPPSSQEAVHCCLYHTLMKALSGSVKRLHLHSIVSNNRHRSWINVIIWAFILSHKVWLKCLLSLE